MQKYWSVKLQSKAKINFLKKRTKTAHFQCKQNTKTLWKHGGSFNEIPKMQQKCKLSPTLNVAILIKNDGEKKGKVFARNQIKVDGNKNNSRKDKNEELECFISQMILRINEEIVKIIASFQTG